MSRWHSCSQTQLLRGLNCGSNHTYMKGQVTTTVAIITAIAMVIVSAITSLATSNGQISEVKNQTSIVEERENNHYMEVQKQLSRIEGKLDQVIKLQ